MSVMTDQEFHELQQKWQREISSYMDTVKGSPHKGNLPSMIDYELVQRRKDELRHAQDVRELYERKLRRANDLYHDLSACVQELEFREESLRCRERKLIEVLNLYAQYGLKPDDRRSGYKVNKIMRPVMVEAGQTWIQGVTSNQRKSLINSPLDVHSSCVNKSAVISIDDPMNQDEMFDDVLLDQTYKPMDMEFEPIHFSRSSSKRSSSGVSSGYFLSRDNLARISGSSDRHCCGHLGNRRTSSKSDKGFHRDSPVRYSANSVKSDMPCSCSKDSNLMEVESPEMNFDPNRGLAQSHCPYSYPALHHYCHRPDECMTRDSPGRWSDGRLQPHVSRDSPGRWSSNRARKYKQRRSHKSSVSMLFGPEEETIKKTEHMETPCSGNNNWLGSAEACLGCHGECSDPSCTMRLKRLGDVVNQELSETQDCNFNKVSFMKHSPSYQEALRRRVANSEGRLSSPNTRRALAPMAHRDVYSDDEINKGKSLKYQGSDGESWSSSDESDEEMKPVTSAKPSPKTSMSPQVVATSSDEENTSDYSRSHKKMTSDPAMMSSGSTMASSLERSLELAANHSDGLSDKEHQVRMVKTSILGIHAKHSNPISNFPISVVCETASSGSESEEQAIV